MHVRNGPHHLGLTAVRSQMRIQVTDGPGPVTDIIKVDRLARVVYYMANGREAGQDPYFGQ